MGLHTMRPADITEPRDGKPLSEKKEERRIKRIERR